VTTSTPPPTTSSTPVTHAKKHVAKRHRHKHPAVKPEQKTAVLATGSSSTPEHTSGPTTASASTSSSSGAVPRIAIFASIAAGSLVLLAAIALGVSMLIYRNRPDRKADGGNILIR
jgi:hypothetical protein